MKFIACILLMGTYLTSSAQGDPKLTEVWNPVPRIVTPGATSQDPPSDAIILFDGKNLNNWVKESDSTPAKWTVQGNMMTVVKNGGDIRTKRKFGDCQLHVEWRSPAAATGEGQNRGNSGVYLMSRYEIQVLDNYNNRTYSNGQAASVYKQRMPLVNAARKPGEWQTYDIIFTAPRFNVDSTLKSPARVTVIHNGVLVQNNVEIWGITQYIGTPFYEKHDDKMPIVLQDHGEPVSFRNIWVREL